MLAVLSLSSSVLPLPSSAPVRVGPNGSDASTVVVQVLTGAVQAPALLVRRGRSVWCPIRFPGSPRRPPVLDRAGALAVLGRFLVSADDAERVLGALLA